jgi:uncharacterized Zn finger protein (UPF0148 family)
MANNKDKIVKKCIEAEQKTSVMCDICGNDTSDPVDDKYGYIVCPKCQVKSNSRYFTEKLDDLLDAYNREVNQIAELENDVDEAVEELCEAIPYLSKVQLLGMIQLFKGEHTSCIGEVFRVAVYDQLEDRFKEMTNVRKKD